MINGVVGRRIASCLMDDEAGYCPEGVPGCGDYYCEECEEEGGIAGG